MKQHDRDAEVWIQFGYSKGDLQRLGGARGQLLYLDACCQFLELDVPIVVFENFLFYWQPTSELDARGPAPSNLSARHCPARREYERTIRTGVRPACA